MVLARHAGLALLERGGVRRKNLVNALVDFQVPTVVDGAADGVVLGCRFRVVTVMPVAKNGYELL